MLAPRQEESLPVDGALNQQYLHPDAGWLGAGSPEEDEKPGAADSSDAALGGNRLPKPLAEALAPIRISIFRQYRRISGKSAGFL